MEDKTFEQEVRQHLFDKYMLKRSFNKLTVAEIDETVAAILAALTALCREYAASELRAAAGDIEAAKITNLCSGWTGDTSGPCCDDCAMTRPDNALAAIVGCRNPFQLVENGGRKLCQCHIAYRQAVQTYTNRHIDRRVATLRVRAEELEGK